MNTFSISEALTFGWETFKKNVSTFIILMVVMFLANVVISLIFGIILGDEGIGAFIGQIASGIASLVVSIGVTKITLDLVDGKTANLSDLYQQYPLFLKFLGATILEGLIVFVGFLLLIIPGIYLAVKLGMTSYLVVDKKLGPIDALKGSYAMTNGNWVNLALLGLASVFITIAGALALLLGLFVAIPVTMIAYAYVYRKLSGGMGAQPATVAPTPVQAVPVSAASVVAATPIEATSNEMPK